MTIKLYSILRPSTETPESNSVKSETPSTKVKYTSIQRNRPVGQYEVEETAEEDIPRPMVTPRYQTIERNRPAQTEEVEDEDDRFRPTTQLSRHTSVGNIVDSSTPRYDIC